MNKIVSTNTGGFPLKSDDLRFMDAAYLDGFKALVRGLLGAYDFGILRGCQVEEIGSNLHVESGYIMYQDEIWYVPAHTVAIVADQTKYFFPELTWDAAGSKTFKSGDVHDTYQLRRMKLYFAASPPAYAMLYDSIPMTDSISDLYELVWRNLQSIFLLKGQEAWNAVTLLNGWANVAVLTYHPAVKYRKESDQAHVEIRGWLDPADATSYTVFTLPAEYRPDWLVSQIIHQSTSNTCRISVDPANGNVNIHDYETGTGDICLNLRFPLT